MSAIRFEILAESKVTKARVGRVHTPHGYFDTPAFMPVGTKATVKGLTPDMVSLTGSQILLNNTYHLGLRPGSQLIAEMGGSHQFMKWDKPILTDSGGFQAFSLGNMNKLDEDGVTFKSHIDGATIRMTPESSIKIQNDLGADIIMAFDDCPPVAEKDLASQTSGGANLVVADEAYRKRNEEAVERTTRWLERCIQAHERPEDQALFGIVQGGTDIAMRAKSLEQIVALDLPGYAIGGVAVGESPEMMKKIVEHTAPLLPDDKPRYLMGVGYERDLLMAVQSGMDMFDCVLPTRNGRNGNAFTPTGQMRIKNARYAKDEQPIDPDSLLPESLQFSRAYLRHLFQSDEMLGPMMVSLHNIAHFQRFMAELRATILTDEWDAFFQRWPVAKNRARLQA